jgi:DNA-binding transcriptional LysR family regulator
VVQLPAVSIADDLAQGRLLRVLPAWSLAQDVIHALFPTVRGLPPPVRDLVDFLVERFGATTGRVQS